MCHDYVELLFKRTTRLRARNRLIELRVADLRFTPAEAAGFLNQGVDLALSPDDVAALETRTEGWMAGLQLAAPSMKGNRDVSGFIQAFAGDHRYWDIVLAPMPGTSEHLRMARICTVIADLTRLSTKLLASSGILVWRMK